MITQLIRKDKWPAFKLRAIREEAKKVMGREFPFIDGRTGLPIQWVKQDNHYGYGTSSVSVDYAEVEKRVIDYLTPEIFK